MTSAAQVTFGILLAVSVLGYAVAFHYSTENAHAEGYREGYHEARIESKAIYFCTTMEGNRTTTDWEIVSFKGSPENLPDILDFNLTLDMNGDGVPDLSYRSTWCVLKGWEIGKDPEGGP